MNSRPSQPPAVLLLGLLGLLALVILGGGAWFLWSPQPAAAEQSASPDRPRPIAPPRPANQTPIERVGPLPAALTPSTPAATPEVRSAIEAPPPDPVSCRQRPNGEPLRGVSLYLEQQAVAGPSDEQGVLRLSSVPEGTVVLWAPGWHPVSAQGDALPEEVLFDPALAGLEVRLENATFEHRLLRSVLLRHDQAALRKGPWSPTLETRSTDRLACDSIPAGTYDVYLWVVFPDGEPRPFNSTGLEVPPHGTTVIHFDMAAPRPADELEDDS